MSQPESSRKFHFLREIASGGFGSVYLAKVLHADGFSRLAAIKLLHPKWSENEEVASRMRDEARLLGQLRHRNIVDVIDLTLIDGRVAVIMEYLEAVDLRTMIKDCVARGELLPTRAVLEATIAVASALDAACNRPPIPGEKPLRVIHRDIKPSNVMLDESGTPKVLDFGVARADFDERESHTQDVAFGSLEYMPPERLFFEPESAASDVYSLGATLFELLALEPFGKAKLRPNQHEEMIFKRLRYLFGRNPVGTPEVRDELKSLLSDMLSFDEADRPSAAQVAERLRGLTRSIREDETLAEWSEANVPRLLRALQEQEIHRPPNPLVDQVLAEDSKGFKRAPAADRYDDRTIPPDDEFAFDGPAPDDDRRWKALKEATLAELNAAEPPPVPKGVRSVAPGQAVVDAIHTGRPAPGRQSGPLPLPPPPPVAPAEGVQTGGAAPREAASKAPAKRSAAPRAGRAAEPAQARRGWGRLVAVVTIGLAAGGALAVVLGLVGAGVGVATGHLPDPLGDRSPFAQGGVGEPEAAPVAEVQVVPAPVPEAAPEPIAGPVIVFVSHLDGTRKITARCDGGTAEGASEVRLGVSGLGDCTVTGFGPERTRLTAVVREPHEGVYACFVGGAKTCEVAGSGDG